MKPTTLKSLCASIPLLVATSSYGADIDFSGFATIAAGTTTSSNEKYLGYTNDIDFNQDSLFALQTSSDLENGFSVTAQLIARGRDDWSPSFEWAFLGYEVNDNWKILAGRQRAPFFMYSDFLDVSFAYHWIAPPAGAYNLAFDSFDGVGSIYTSQLGEFDSTFHAVFGRNRDELTISTGEEVNPDFKNLVGAAWTVNRDWLTLRTAYFQAEMTIPVNAISPVIDGWKAAGFEDVANSIETKEDDVWFAELGFQIDYNDIFVVGEFTRVDIEGAAFSNDDSYYVSVGKRFDEFTLHVTYGKDDDELENLLAGVPNNVAAIAPLYTATQGIIANEMRDESYLTVGLKYDFHPTASFKFEVTQFENDLNSQQDSTLVKAALVTVF
ncbi:porin [Psychrobium sp. MM17-31]|uniref:porin n=1 Tax=Psychrobium sp. MM17-31 TaxID=2917758 RepID=UPI001EF42A2C|nr:porin [Psychrobium sp. MM17-31]MCG7531016.1 porin [Psychrobium sp. MM17-31]